VGAHGIGAVAEQEPSDAVSVIGRYGARDGPLVQVHDPSGRSETAVGEAVVSWHHERDHGFADARDLKARRNLQHHERRGLYMSDDRQRANAASYEVGVLGNVVARPFEPRLVGPSPHDAPARIRREPHEK
jgi:hypothetical protein